jgi:hypothetical protein
MLAKMFLGCLAEPIGHCRGSFWLWVFADADAWVSSETSANMFL